jgi:hypothetical protein
MSGTSIDDGTDSDQFMSLPGTPTADDDAAFLWKGESVHDYRVLWWLIYATATAPRHRPFLRISPYFRNVPRALYSPICSKW